MFNEALLRTRRYFLDQVEALEHHIFASGITWQELADKGETALAIRVYRQHNKVTYIAARNSVNEYLDQQDNRDQR